MKITSIKTNKIVPNKQTLFDILDTYVLEVKEKSVLAITSKIVAITEGRVVHKDGVDKPSLIKKESQYYLPPDTNAYSLTITIKNNLLIPSAGIDESNAGNYLVLWPEDPQKTANDVRAYLKKRFKLKHVGVVITDSKTSPLRWGTTGVAVSYSGFRPLNDYIGTPDIFGRTLKVTKSNIMDALAGASVMVMGEGKEQTPLAMIEDVPFVKFLSSNPSQKELKDLRISIEEDLYASILNSVDWKKGGVK